MDAATQGIVPPAAAQDGLQVDHSPRPTAEKGQEAEQIGGRDEEADAETVASEEPRSSLDSVPGPTGSDPLLGDANDFNAIYASWWCTRILQASDFRLLFQVIIFVRW